MAAWETHGIHEDGFNLFIHLYLCGFLLYVCASRRTHSYYLNQPLFQNSEFFHTLFFQSKRICGAQRRLKSFFLRVLTLPWRLLEICLIPLHSGCTQKENTFVHGTICFTNQWWTQVVFWETGFKSGNLIIWLFYWHKNVTTPFKFWIYYLLLIIKNIISSA